MRENKKSALPGFPWKGKFTTKKEIDQYFSNPEGIQCLCCGRIYEGLNGHLQIVHGVSFEKYRDRYGLPWRKGLLSWLTPFLVVRLFWWAVGIHSNTPLTSLLHGRSNNKILLLIQEDIPIKNQFLM